MLISNAEAFLFSSRRVDIFSLFWQLNGHAALVRRGECTFTRMARTAQAAGANALIVVNDKEGTKSKQSIFVIIIWQTAALTAAEQSLGLKQWFSSLSNVMWAPLCSDNHFFFFFFFILSHSHLISLFSWAELCKMVCSENGTFTDIQIPSVLVPKSAGDILEAGLLRGETGSFSKLLIC